VHLCVGLPPESAAVCHRRIDLVFCTRIALPFITLQWTGSKHGLFQRELRRIAAFRGFHLSSTFLCKVEREFVKGNNVGKVRRVGSRIDCANEAAVFAALGLPHRAKDRRELDADFLREVSQAYADGPTRRMQIKEEFNTSGKTEWGEVLAAKEEDEEDEFAFKEC